ncbi:MAG: flagellar hook assembly protein FlgD [Thermodesulfobacteriota bacterium]
MQTNPLGLAAMAGASGPTGGQEVSSDMFLKLLVTQLKNQDPLSPTDNTAFVAQLAQFSSLEGINNLNDNFTGVTESMNSLNNFGTANLIGRNVTVKGDSLNFKGAPASLGYELNNPAETVTLTVFDNRGRVVSSDTAKDVGAGSHVFSWDGLDAAGNPLPAGEYGFTVTTGDVNGNDIPLDTYISGTVEGVDFFGNEAKVSINGAMFSAGDIKEIF